MKIGLSSGLTHTTPQHWAQQLKGLGCKSVTFPVNCNSDKDIIRAYADAANEAGLVIAEVGIWNNMLDQDPEKRKVALDYNIRQLILADEIGALCAVNVAGTPHGPRWDGGYRDNFSEETFQLTVETVQYILQQANVQNTYFCIESMPWMIPTGPEEYAQLIARVDHPRFAAHLDLVNMITSPRRYFFHDEFMKQCFELLKGHICSCHLKDIRLKDEYTFQLQECGPGEGTLNLELFAQLCDRENPDMPVIIEHLRGDEVYKKTLAYVQRRLQLD